MKVICDNEKQKEEFLYLFTCSCPNIFGLNDREMCTCGKGTLEECKKCWEESGLEVVLKEDEPQVAYLCDQKYCELCENPDCKHTLDITHAVNFEKFENNKYMEKEKKND